MIQTYLKFTFMFFSFLIVVLFSSLIVGCSGDRSHMTGGSTETVGYVLDLMGNPVDSAQVLFIPSDYSPNDNSAHFDTLITDEKGTFSFGLIQNGVYNIHIEKEGEQAYRSAVQVMDGAVDTVISDTIKETGAISGVVQLQEQHDNKEVYLLLLGSNSFTSPLDSVGNFSFSNLAEGTYSLRIITSYNDYEVIDTFLTIYSGEQEVIQDTIKMQYVGISVPENLSVTYDTLMQSATISWNRVLDSNCVGYILYRSPVNNPLDITFVGEGIITDTAIADYSDGAAILSDSSYQYRVSAVHKDGMCGKTGGAWEVTFTSAFTLEESTKLPVDGPLKSVRMLLTTSNEYYMYTPDKSTIRVFDRDLTTVIREFVLPFDAVPYTLHEMEDSTLLFATNRGVFNLDRTGKQLYHYNIVTKHLSSVDSRYIYYSSSVSSFFGLNSIIALDSYTGIEDTILIDKRRAIADFEIRGETLNVLFNEYGEITLEKSAIMEYKPQIVYRKSGVQGTLDLVLSPEGIRLLCSKEVLQFNKRELVSRMVVSGNPTQLLCVGENEYCLIDDEGYYTKYKQTVWGKGFSAQPLSYNREKKKARIIYEK